MSALTLLKSKLKPLGLYNLSSGSIINAELSAYAVGFELLNEKFNELERECFISTSQSFGLDLREKLFGYLKSDLGNSERRERLLYRNKITSNDYTKIKIEEAAKSCGIEGYIIENKGGTKFDFNCNDTFSSDEERQSAINEAKQFLPAHLRCDFDFRDLSWDKINENDYTFNQMDAEDLTWNEIDT